MIRTLATLAALLALLIGALWGVARLRPERLPPQLRTVDLGEVLDSAAARARQLAEPPDAAAPESPAPQPKPAPPPPEPSTPPATAEAEPEPPPEEELVLEPPPFVELPTEPAEEPAQLARADRDQDAWAALIRRMLALHRRARGR